MVATLETLRLKEPSGLSLLKKAFKASRVSRARLDPLVLLGLPGLKVFKVSKVFRVSKESKDLRVSKESRVFKENKVNKEKLALLVLMVALLPSSHIP
jgi:hypothetical protein